MERALSIKGLLIIASGLTLFSTPAFAQQDPYTADLLFRGALSLVFLATVAPILFMTVFLYPTWRIFRRAGFHPALSLLILVPFVGWLIVVLILGFATWPTTQRHADSGGDA